MSLDFWPPARSSTRWARIRLGAALAALILSAPGAFGQTAPTGAAGPPPSLQGDAEPAQDRLAQDRLAPNYKKPKPKLRTPKPNPPAHLYGPRSATPDTPLPPLEAYRTSWRARLEARRDPAARRRNTPPPPTVAAAPTIRQKPRPRPDPHPFDPVGIGLGGLRLTPSIDASYGLDSNPNRIAGDHQGSSLLRLDGALDAQSDWARHAFNAKLRLGYSDYARVPEASRPDGAGLFSARLDVTRDTALTFDGRFSLDTQRPGAPAISSGLPNVVVTNRPIILSAGTSVGVMQTLGRLSLAIRGSFDRSIYENAHYSDGSTLNLASTNFNDYGVTGRAAFEVSPALQPFAEATYDTRQHDDRIDVYGYQRDSDGVAARAGVRLRPTELLRGDISGGYAERRYDDPRLPLLRGPTLDAEIIYAPTPLTTLTLKTTTTLNETTAAGASGVLNRAYTATLSHDLFRNVTISAQGSFLTNDYQGADIREKLYGAGFKLEYKVTRSLAIHGSYLFEHLHSTAPGADYTANVFLVGLRLQR